MIKTRLLGLLSHTKKQIAFTVFYQWAALLTQILAVYTVTGLFAKVLTRDFSWEQTYPAMGVFLVVIVLRFICETKAAKASCLASADVKHIIRKEIYEKLLRLGASYKEQTSTSEVVQLCAEGVEQLETYFGKYLPQLFYSLLAPVTLFVILSFVSVKAALVLLVCVPLIPISIVAVQKIAAKLLNRYWSIYAGLGDSFLENLQGLTTLKIYQADEKKAKEMDEEALNFRRITMKVLTMQLNSTSVMDLIAYGGAALGMIVAVKEYLSGNLDIQGTFMIILLASEFFIPLRLSGSFFHIAMNGMAASDKMFRLLDLEEPEKGTKDMPEGALDIQFRNVCFSYEENREILKGIDLSIPAGSLVSLAGESGCGKSTVAGLLAGRNRGYQGKIHIGDCAISDIRESELMKHITVVKHNSYLFKGTVEENLRMAKEDATEEEMQEVLKKVNLLEFLNTQKGLKTELAEKAGNLSGGQCQRLAMARALLHDTPVYIFDEATSNIDMESEEMIMQVILELAKTRTVLLISHRLSNITVSDEIYLLSGGKVAEHGSHETLMAQKGPYQRLFESQMQLEQYGKAVEA